MNKRRILIPLALALLVCTVAVVYTQRDKAEPDSSQIANSLAAGKPITWAGGESIRSMSPSAGYFELPAGPQRVAYLDKLIDDQEAMRKKIASGEIALPPGVGSATAPAARGEGEENVRSSVESHTSEDGKEKRVTVRLNSDDLSPTLRAQMQEFAGALRNRRKERGLDPEAPIMIFRTEVRTQPK